LILIIYEINNIGVQNAGKLTGMNAEGAALAPSAGESPIHHSFGVFFWPAHARAFFMCAIRSGLLASCGTLIAALPMPGYNHPSNNGAQRVPGLMTTA
jgi:hypothetical protein